MEARRLLEALLGAYVAMLLVPAAVLLGFGPAGRPPLATLVVVGGLVATVVALAARSVPTLPARLASRPSAAGTVGPPLAYLPLLVLAVPPASPAARIALVGLLAVLPGIGLPIGGTVLRNRRLRARATTVTEVTVGDSDDGGRDRQLIAGLAVVGLAFVAAGAATLYAGDADAGALGSTFGGLWTAVLLLAHDESAEVAVTDEGLRIDRGFTRWVDLEGYRVTDESVALVRSQWYLPDRDFDRDAIDDEAALLDALGRYLPRLDAASRVDTPVGP